MGSTKLSGSVINVGVSAEFIGMGFSHGYLTDGVRTYEVTTISTGPGLPLSVSTTKFTSANKIGTVEGFSLNFQSGLGVAAAIHKGTSGTYGDMSTGLIAELTASGSYTWSNDVTDLIWHGPTTLPSSGSGVMPADLVSKLSHGQGLGIPAGYEFNALDAFSERLYRAGTPQRAPTPSGSHSSSNGLKSTGYVGDHPVPISTGRATTVDTPAGRQIVDLNAHYGLTSAPHMTGTAGHPQKDADMSPTTATRPSLGYGAPASQSAIDSLSYSMGTPVRPSLSYGLPVTQAAINALPYSMGTAMGLSFGSLSSTTSISSLPYSMGKPVVAALTSPKVTTFAPTASPKPAPKPGFITKDVFGNTIYHGPNGESWNATKLDKTFDGTSNPNGTVKQAIGGGFKFVDIKTGMQHQSQQGRGDLSHEDTRSQAEKHDDHTDHPILLDLDGNGVKVNELTRSTKFIDAGGDGLSHRTAWAGAAGLAPTLQLAVNLQCTID